MAAPIYTAFTVLKLMRPLLLLRCRRLVWLVPRLLLDPRLLALSQITQIDSTTAVDGGPVHVLLKHDLPRRDWAEHRHYVVRFDLEVDARVA